METVNILDFNIPFEFDLQLFAEGPEPDPEPEPEPEPEPPVITNYQFKYKDQDIDMSPEEFERFYTDYKAEANWKTKYHDKGRDLNKQQDELNVKEKELSVDKELLNEWKDIKKKLDASPEARQQVAQWLNQSKPTIDPVIKSMQKDNEDLRKDINRDKAINQMSQKYKDFDHEKLLEYQRDFNFDNMEDMMRFTLMAWRGSQVEDRVQEARAEIVKGMQKKKGLPPTGKKVTVPKEKPKSFQDMIDMAHARVDEEGSII